MELLQVVVIVTLLGFLDAKSCYFIKTIINWGRDWNDFKTNTSLYKTKISSVYCSYDEVCCGRSCCPDPSVTPKYYYYDTYNYQYDSSDDDSKMSTGSTLGTAFAVVIVFSFCMSCCIACCKQQKNERQNVNVCNAPPIVAYSSDIGAVIVRQVPRDNTSSSSSSASSSPGGEDNSNHDTSQPYAASETYGFSSLDTREHEAPPYESANLLQVTEPPPSYEYVMSHNYPTNSDNEKSSAKTSNEPSN